MRVVILRVARFLPIGLGEVALRFGRVVGSAKPSGVVPRDDGGELKGEDPSGDVVYIISGEWDRGALPILRRADEFFVNFVNGEAVFDGAVSVCSAVTGRGGDS